MRFIHRSSVVVGLVLLLLAAAACQTVPEADQAVAGDADVAEGAPVVETDAAVEETAVPEPEPEPDTAELLLGVWSGRLQTPAGFVYPSEWEFKKDGTMLLTVLTDEGTINLSYAYYFDPDGALRLDGQDGNEPGRREVFFETADKVRLVAVRDGIVTLLLRGPLEDADTAGLQEVALRVE